MSILDALGLGGLLGGGSYGTDPNAVAMNGQQQPQGGGLLGRPFGGGGGGLFGDGGDLYGDALTPAQKAAIQKRRVGGYLKSVAPLLGYSLDPGKVGSPLQIIAAGLGGMGEEQDSAALNALRAGQLGLQTKELQQRQGLINDLFSGMRGQAPSGAPATAASLPGPNGAPQGKDGAVDKFLDLTEQKESGGQNIPQQVVGPNGGFNPSVGRVTGPSSAQGYYQIINPTWQRFAPQAGVDLAQYPTAMSAPRDVQRAVARTIATTDGVQHWTDYNPALRAAAQDAGLPVRGPISDSAPQRPIQLAQAGPIQPGLLGGGQAPAPAPDISLGTPDQMNRWNPANNMPPGTTVNSRGMPIAPSLLNMPPDQAARVKVADAALRNGTAWGPQNAAPAPAGGLLAPGGSQASPAPQTAPAAFAATPTPMLGNIPLTPENILKLGVAGDLLKIPSLGTLLTNTPAYQADLAAAKERATRDVSLGYVGPEAQLKASGERSITEPSDIRIAQARADMERETNRQRMRDEVNPYSFGMGTGGQSNGISGTGPGYSEPLTTERGSAIPPVSAASPIVGSPAYLKERQTGKGGWSDKENALNQALDTNPQDEQVIKTLANVFKSYGTGSFAGAFSDLKAKAKGLGIPESMLPAGNDPAQAQLASKLVFQRMIGRMRGIDSNPTGWQIKEMVNNWAGTDSQPEANLGMMAQSLGVIRQTDALARDWSQAKKYGWVDPQDFERAWLSMPQNSLASFTDKAANELGPFKGMQGNNAASAPPRVSQEEYNRLPPGSLFTAPNGAVMRKPGAM